ADPEHFADDCLRWLVAVPGRTLELRERARVVLLAVRVEAAGAVQQVGMAVEEPGRDQERIDRRVGVAGVARQRGGGQQEQEEDEAGDARLGHWRFAGMVGCRGGRLSERWALAPAGSHARPRATLHRTGKKEAALARRFQCCMTAGVAIRTCR